MFDEKEILIVEDDVYTALDLAGAVEDANGRVVGPHAFVCDALECLEHVKVDAAILDAQLCDRDVTPLALRLTQMGLPFVIQSGTGLPPALKAVIPDLPVLTKPISPRVVVAHLLGQIRQSTRVISRTSVSMLELPRLVVGG